MSDLNSPRLINGLADSLPKLASSAGLAGIFGVFISLLANGILFRIWGINFFQIASPSDILMSGADVISNIAILLFISSIMSLIYLSFMYVANKSIGDIGRHILLPNDVAKDAYPLVLIAVSLFVYFGNLYYNFGINVFGSKFESVNFNSSLFLESNWFIIQSSVVSVIFYSMIVDFRTPIFIKFKTALNSLYSIMFILGAIVLSHIFNHAVFLRPDWYVFGPNVDCKVNATAAWIGSESVVVVCGNSNRRVVESDNFSVLPREGLTFKKIPEKKNDAQTH